jgi:hypothetical protein
MNERVRRAAIIAFAAGLWSSGCSVEERPFADGPGGSGGSGGGGGDGSGGGTGGSADACAKALACDDFEGQTVDTVPSGAFFSATEAGEVIIDNTRASSGKLSVRLSTGATDGFKAAMLNFSDPSKLPTPGNSVFGRMMFWLDSAPAGEVQWSFIIGKGPIADASGLKYTALYRYGGQIPILNSGAFVGSQLMANYETPDSYNNPPIGPSTDCWSHSSGRVVPVGKWTCAEFHFNGANNEMQLWLDGADLPDLHVQKYGQGCTGQAADYPWIAPTFTEVFVGWESYTLDEPRTIWIDDLAIGTERLGCP